MDSQYASMINKLDSLKDDLIQTIQTSSNNDELSKKLISMAARDPINSELYQLVLLVSSNVETNYNYFKQTSIRAITDMISQKIKLIEILDEHGRRLTKMEEVHAPTPRLIKIPLVGEIEIGVIKIKDIAMFLVLIFITLFLMNVLDHDSTKRTISDVKSFIGSVS